MAATLAGDLFSVHGLIAVITGGGTGIGLMMAKALAANGAARVYIVGRRKEVLEAAVKQCKAEIVVPLTGDVTSKDSLRSIVDQITKKEGYINVLICNAGMPGPGMGDDISRITGVIELQSHFWNMSSQSFNECLSRNTTSVFYSAVAFLGLLDSGNKKGNVEMKSQVLATSSIGAYMRRINGVSYGASKAALTQMMKVMATIFAAHQIRFNILAPGGFRSELTQHMPPFNDLQHPCEEDDAVPADAMPLRRAGTEKDIAGMILYIVSRAGAYCNGSVLVADGGRMCVHPASY